MAAKRLGSICNALAGDDSNFPVEDSEKLGSHLHVNPWGMSCNDKTPIGSVTICARLLIVGRVVLEFDGAQAESRDGEVEDAAATQCQGGVQDLASVPI